MTDQVTTRACPDCRTIFRHRGQDRCPHCGHGFGTVQSPSSAEGQAVPERPAVVETPAPPPPPPPPPPPSRTEPVHESTSELDALLIPYASNDAHSAEPPVAEAPVESTIPPFELPPEPEPAPEPPRVPMLHAPSMDPVDEALAGNHLVPANSQRSKSRRSRMPWYLRREILIGLALVAVVLIAVIVQLST